MRKRLHLHLSLPALVLSTVLVVTAAIARPELMLPGGSLAGINGSILGNMWLLAILFLGVGALYAIADVVRVRDEWRAVEALENGDKGALEGRHRGTISGTRHRAVAAMPSDVPPATRWFDSQRAHANTELSSLGTTTRFLSGALLLLAVIGTFGGLREAMPDLVSAIKAFGEAAADNSDKVSTALQKVSAAFGANFVALVGSLALGVAAFGVSSERRQLLLRIEVVSDEALYHKWSHSPTDQSALQRAIEKLGSGVDKLSEVADGNRQLESAIREHTTTLRNALGGLRTAFAESLRIQTVQLQQQLTATVDRLSGDVALVVQGVQSTGVAYAGLVAALRERHGELERAGSDIRSATTQLATELAGSVQSLKVSLEDAGKRQATLVASTESTAALASKALESIAGTTEQLGVAASAQQESGQAMKQAATSMEESHRAWLSAAIAEAEKHGRQWQEALGSLAATESAIGEKLSAVVDEQRRIGDDFSAGAQRLGTAFSSAIEVVLQGQKASGAAVAQEIGELHRVVEIAASTQATLVSSLMTQVKASEDSLERNVRANEELARQYQNTTRDIQKVGQGMEALAPLFERLTGRLEALQRQVTTQSPRRGLWSRLTGRNR